MHAELPCVCAVNLGTQGTTHGLANGGQQRGGRRSSLSAHKRGICQQGLTCKVHTVLKL